MKPKYYKENLESLVKKCKSFRELCRMMGMAETGNAHLTIKKYVKLHKIDTIHFLSQEEHLKLANRKRTALLSEILVENSTYSNSCNLKRKILKEGLLKYECCECGNKGVWEDKPLVLQIHHINGIKRDNRITNLAIICPNCHTQTHTFTNRKR